MRYHYTLAASQVSSAFPAQAVALAFQRLAGARAEADYRWPMILRKLATLRDRGRRSIRVIDATCGTGDMLVAVVQRARALGFVAIEGRGIDRDARRIAKAQAVARRLHDPAIGLVFEVGDAAVALREEAEFPADLVLYAMQGDEDRALPALARAAGGSVLYADRAAAA